MINEEKEEFEQSDWNSIKNASEVLIEKVNQDLIERYLSLFPKQLQIAIEAKFKSINMEYFQRFNIEYNPEVDCHYKLSFKLINQSINSQVIVLEGRWGQFTCKLKILNVINKSNFHKEKQVKGSYGNIYLAKACQSQFVIKCIHYETWKDNKEAKWMAIKELILLKIASALEIGPRIQQYLGFDLIIYENCIQFAIQKCEEIKFLRKGNLSLWQDLYLMHKFHIVHFDIKPQNIMFSRSYNKVVYIDFGLSKIEQIDIGQRISAFFRGTLNICSPEMIQAFDSNSECLVDIYYNDAYSLNLTLQLLEANSIQKSHCLLNGDLNNDSEDQVLALDEPENKTIQLYRLKYCLFENKTDRAMSLLHQYQTNNSSCFAQILDYMHELDSSEQIRQFYLNYTSFFKLEGISYAYLNALYRYKTSTLRYLQPIEEKRQLNVNNFINIFQIGLQSEYIFLTQTKMRELLNKNFIKNMDLFTYFRLFLNYVTFVGNIYEVCMKQKMEMVHNFMKNQITQLNIEQNLGDLKLIRKCFHYMIDRILSPLQKKVNQANIVKLLFDLVENLMILNTQCHIAIIIDLQRIYNHQILDYPDKIEFLLRIKHTNSWFMYRYHSIYKSIFQWCFHKMTLLSQKAYQKKFNWIAKHLEKGWSIYSLVDLTQSQQILLAQMPFNSLYLQLTLQIYSDKLRLTEPKHIQQITNQMYKKIPTQQKSKIFFIEFILYDIYLDKYSRYDICRQIVSNIKNRLNCQEIMNSLFVQTALNFIQIKKTEIFLDKFLSFLQKITFNTIVTHHQFIQTAIKRICYIQKDRTLDSVFMLVTKKLEIMIEQIDLKTVWMGQAISQFQNHKCINYRTISCIIQIKLLFFYLIGKPYDPRQEMITFEYNISPELCLNCYLIFHNIMEQETQKNVVNQMDITGQGEQQFMMSYNRLQAINQQYCGNTIADHFIKMQYYSLFTFCKNHKFEEKYRGIITFYKHLRDRNCLEDYLNSCQINNNILKIIFTAIINHIPLDEFAFFLNHLTLYMTQQEFVAPFYFLFDSFQYFASICESQLNFDQLIHHIYQMNSNQKNNYSSIYICICLPYLPLTKINKAKLNLISSIDKLPQSIRQYLQCQFYRFLLVENIKKIHEEKMASRKQQSLRAKALKMMTALQEKSNFQVKHKKKLSDKKIQILKSKADRLGGPYYLKQPYLQTVQIVPKLKKISRK